MAGGKGGSLDLDKNSCRQKEVKFKFSKSKRRGDLIVVDLAESCTLAMSSRNKNASHKESGPKNYDAREHPYLSENEIREKKS